MESMAEGMIKDLVASGHALADDMTGAPSVLVRCLAAQLEVQLVRANALAAENAALKSALNAILQPDAAVLERNHRVRALDAMATPATEAHLAEVRAQGVEMFADKYRAQLTALPTTPENIFDAAHVSLRYQIFDADEFAAQLRKGVQS
ncbi:hypothetical protein GYC36_003102 [Salmonella enterica]|nr:hypothetical protein [Salmonella enterica]EBD6167561.1 hypothetical protein [Salmonella enterica]EBE5317951.1 hypothetical protein [Salmonella enterica]EBQ8616455.1 hypothetical protein [Salmonella enterica]ECK5658541.1 hypothetical protein [Salmonella enterica]